MGILMIALGIFLVLFGLIGFSGAVSARPVSAIGLIVALILIAPGALLIRSGLRRRRPPAALPEQMDARLCTACGLVVTPKRVMAGNTLAELVLWFAGLLPGLIYSIWRLNSRHVACPSCGGRELLPPDSPRAKALLADLRARG